MAAQPVLPDFEAISRSHADLSRSHADLSRELGRCGNLPIVQEGNLLLQAFREMREEMRGEMRGMREEMRGEMRGMREEMREMRGEMREMREEIRQVRNLVAIR